MEKILIVLKKINTKYCWLVFMIAWWLWFWMIHETLFTGIYTILWFLFTIVFALTVTCLIRNIKEKVKLANKAWKSLIWIIGATIWIATAQLCWINAVFCGSTIWMWLLSTILPTTTMWFLSEYSVIIIILSIITQLIWLYFMKCFVKK